MSVISLGPGEAAGNPTALQAWSEAAQFIVNESWKAE